MTSRFRSHAFVLRQLELEFDQTRVRRLSSPRPNPESSLAFLFVALQEGIDEKVNILRYYVRWIFKKNAKNLFFAVQIEKTEKNNLQKEWRKKLFYFLR